MNIAFLANANLALTLPWDSPYRVDGINADGSMNGDTLQKFIKKLNDGFFLGLNQWMVPAISSDGQNLNCTVRTGDLMNPAIGYNCDGVASPLGELFYDQLGGKPGHDIAERSNTFVRLFRYLQSGYYWQCQPSALGATCMTNTASGEPSLSFRTGYQGHQTQIDEMFVMLAVPGDAIPASLRWWEHGRDNDHDQHQ